MSAYGETLTYINGATARHGTHLQPRPRHRRLTARRPRRHHPRARQPAGPSSTTTPPSPSPRPATRPTVTSDGITIAATPTPGVTYEAIPSPSPPARTAADVDGPTFTFHRRTSADGHLHRSQPPSTTTTGDRPRLHRRARAGRVPHRHRTPEPPTPGPSANPSAATTTTAPSTPSSTSTTSPTPTAPTASPTPAPHPAGSSPPPPTLPSSSPTTDGHAEATYTYFLPFGTGAFQLYNPDRSALVPGACWLITSFDDPTAPAAALRQRRRPQRRRHHRPRFSTAHLLGSPPRPLPRPAPTPGRQGHLRLPQLVHRRRTRSSYALEPATTAAIALVDTAGRPVPAGASPSPEHQATDSWTVGEPVRCDNDDGTLDAVVHFNHLPNPNGTHRVTNAGTPPAGSSPPHRHPSSSPTPTVTPKRPTRLLLRLQPAPPSQLSTTPTRSALLPGPCSPAITAFHHPTLQLRHCDNDDGRNDGVTTVPASSRPRHLLGSPPRPLPARPLRLGRQGHLRLPKLVHRRRTPEQLRPRTRHHRGDHPRLTPPGGPCRSRASTVTEHQATDSWTVGEPVRCDNDDGTLDAIVHFNHLPNPNGTHRRHQRRHPTRRAPRRPHPLARRAHLHRRSRRSDLHVLLPFGTGAFQLYNPDRSALVPGACWLITALRDPTPPRCGTATTTTARNDGVTTIPALDRGTYWEAHPDPYPPGPYAWAAKGTVRLPKLVHQRPHPSQQLRPPTRHHRGDHPPRHRRAARAGRLPHRHRTPSHRLLDRRRTRPLRQRRRHPRRRRPLQPPPQPQRHPPRHQRRHPTRPGSSPPPKLARRAHLHRRSRRSDLHVLPALRHRRLPALQPRPLRTGPRRLLGSSPVPRDPTLQLRHCDNRRRPQRRRHHRPRSRPRHLLGSPPRPLPARPLRLGRQGHLRLLQTPSTDGGPVEQLRPRTRHHRGDRPRSTRPGGPCRAGASPSPNTRATDSWTVGEPVRCDNDDGTLDAVVHFNHLPNPNGTHRVTNAGTPPGGLLAGGPVTLSYTNGHATATYTYEPHRRSLDADGDGVPDGADNCPAVANAGQADGDHDGQRGCM